mmetsp:Transcript_25094/g.58165  ORF Transcript_25094/g.58165 Transcript_25094/m.58165 type:complete len:99 (+) Transcript_25094:54-350(+)
MHHQTPGDSLAGDSFAGGPYMIWRGRPRKSAQLFMTRVKVELMHRLRWQGNSMPCAKECDRAVKEISAGYGTSQKSFAIDRTGIRSFGDASGLMSIDV